MKLLNLLKTASREANTLAIASVLLLTTKILVLNKIPAAFTGAYELGIIAEAILASIIASYVFYVVVVHIKEQSDREVLQPFIEKHSKRIIGDCLSQIEGVSKSSNTPLNIHSISKDSAKAALSKIHPYSDAPMLINVQPMTYANWPQYFINQESRTKGSIKKLLDQLPFLDAQLISIITDIDDCAHFNMFSAIAGRQIGNTDLANFSDTFFEYCMMCKRLDNHLTKLGFTSAIPDAQS